MHMSQCWIFQQAEMIEDVKKLSKQTFKFRNWLECRCTGLWTFLYNHGDWPPPPYSFLSYNKTKALNNTATILTSGAATRGAGPPVAVVGASWPPTPDFQLLPLAVDVFVAEPDDEADGSAPPSDRAHLNSQSEFQAPSEVRSSRPAMLSTWVALSHDHPSVTGCPLRVMFETCWGTPKTVTFARGMVSVKLPDGRAATEVFEAESCGQQQIVSFPQGLHNASSLSMNKI